MTHSPMPRASTLGLSHRCMYGMSCGVREHGCGLPTDACADGVATEMVAWTKPHGDCDNTLLRPDPPRAVGHRWENGPQGSGGTKCRKVDHFHLTSHRECLSAFGLGFRAPRGRWSCGTWRTGYVPGWWMRQLHGWIEGNGTKEQLWPNVNVNFAIMPAWIDDLPNEVSSKYRPSA